MAKSSDALFTNAAIPTNRLTGYLDRRELELLHEFFLTSATRDSDAANRLWHRVRELYLLRLILIGTRMPSLNEWVQAGLALLRILETQPPVNSGDIIAHWHNILPPTVSLDNPGAIPVKDMDAYLRLRDKELLTQCATFTHEGRRFAPKIDGVKNSLLDCTWDRAHELQLVREKVLIVLAQPPNRAAWTALASRLYSSGDYEHFRQSFVHRYFPLMTNESGPVSAEDARMLITTYREAISA